MKTAKVEITVTMFGQTKTFTASGETSGDADKTARGLINAVAGDACNWTHDVKPAKAWLR